MADDDNNNNNLDDYIDDAWNIDDDWNADDQAAAEEEAAAEEVDANEAAVEYDPAQDGFDGYVETTVDPGNWLLLGTIIFCFGVMLVVVPCLVAWKLRRQREQATSAQEHLVNDDDTDNFDNLQDAAPVKPPVRTGLGQVLWPDAETRRILQLALPYTVSALTSSTFANLCLILISQHIGTKPVAAYALVHVLVGLTDGALQGPIYACTTLCAQAVGAGNTLLAGQYIQLAVLLYMLGSLPVIFLLWWNGMYAAILYLEWGDEETANLAQEFTRVIVWSYLLGGISGALWQLLEVTNHAVAGTVISTLWGATNVAVIFCMIFFLSRDGVEASLVQVGWVHNATALFYIGLTLVLAAWGGWLKPFSKGLFWSCSLCNFSALRRMMQQGIPLAFGSLLSNAEWAILTFFASQLGPAEVAAWALLGSIWDVFYSVTNGIGDAAEIRVAYHLGDNHPTMAKLSAYKSLLLGMLVASCVSVLYFSMQDRIPAWFTSDETLQAMLSELVPFVGVANLTMTFGMQCWSLVGAQGEYKLATWISLISSWGIVMPLAAFYVFVLRIDLQGLTSAVCVGYLCTGSALSFVLLSTNWPQVAKKIQEQNSDTAAGGNGGRADQQFYAAMRFNSVASKMAARRNIRLLTLPPGQRSGIILCNLYAKGGTYVLMVRDWSPWKQSVKVGDAILAIDGVDVSQESAEEVSKRLKTSKMFDRHVSVAAPPADVQNDEGVELQEIAEDESSEAPSKIQSFGTSSFGSGVKIF